MGADSRLSTLNPQLSTRRPRYAELHAKTNFSFLQGASHPDELVKRAAELGLAALAVTDRNSLAGVVRAHRAAKEVGLKLLIGAEVTPIDAPPLVLLATDRAAYGHLARLLTVGRRCAEKGDCRLTFDDVAEHADGLLAMVSGPWSESRDESRESREGFGNQALSTLVSRLSTFRDVFGNRCYLLAELHRGPDDERLLDFLMRASRQARVPLVAANDVHYHVPERQALQDVLTAARLGCTVRELAEQRKSGQWPAPRGQKSSPPYEGGGGGGESPATAHRPRTTDHCLFPNAERHLKSPQEMVALFAPCPDAIRRTIEIADRCTFSLDELRYEYPEELCPPGTTPIEHLRRLTWEGARERYGSEGARGRGGECDTQGAGGRGQGSGKREQGRGKREKGTEGEVLPPAICPPPTHSPTRPLAHIPTKVRRLIEHELKLIEELHYEAYFLTVWDLVRFARSRGILCQGRGSAANSAVCYCLGITAVDPAKIDVLFERFVSRERNEAPDIDVDFEHERREEVIQYVYEKYGRDRAGMTAEVITYRPRSAVRDVGKALGLSLERVDALAKTLDSYGEIDRLPERCREAGIDPRSPVGRQLVRFVCELAGFPRHLSQHVGGMVITRGPLCELVPIENAAMPGRTVIEWDKDDLDDLGILKVDCLALGMLTAIRKCFDLVAKWASERGGEGDTPGAAVKGRKSGKGTERGGEGARGPLATLRRSVAKVDPCSPDPQPPTPYPLAHSPTRSLACVPAEDPAVYEMISRADTVGVFQIESRAQMSMLPRLKPRCFYDLVIEVAIVRPGPIQGNMVHPYLRRRAGKEPVVYPNEAVREVLEKTLGVPIFQEQAMRLAIVAAGFTPGEADQLRRAMGGWRRPGLIDQFRQKLGEGMLARGYSREFAEQVFNQIRGFGEYGFPESHAASFALLVYVSAWLKKYHPAAFTAALLNSQPMGFYAPAQLVRDAQQHGVEVRPADVNHSEWDCTLQKRGQGSGVGGPQGREPQMHTDEYGSTLATLRRSVADAQFAHSLTRSLPHSPALRLGFRLVKGFSEAHAAAIARARGDGPFASIEDFTQRTGLSRAVVVRLAKADAFGSLHLDRRNALWQALEVDEEPPLFRGQGSGVRGQESGQWSVASGQRSSPPSEGEVGGGEPLATDPWPLATGPLAAMPPEAEVFADYQTTGLSLKAHPVSFVRSHLDDLRAIPAARLATLPTGRFVRVAGLVLLRQQPSTAKGIRFVTLEDETGTANLVVRPDVWDHFQHVARTAQALLVHGRLERQEDIIHVVASKLEDLSRLLKGARTRSRDFR